MHRTTLQTTAGPRSALIWNIAPADAPWLHFAHATGMHSGLYARLLEPLADRFHIVASDSRGHGHSPDGPVGDKIEWDDFAADLLAVIDAVNPTTPWLLAGHSMGGSVSLLAANAQPDRVTGLVLIEPPFIPFATARAANLAGETLPNPMADQAVRRRADFPDIAAARAAYAGRGVFRSWSDADLDAYLADGLLPTANGLTLACPPAWESATFRGVSHHIEAALAALDKPFALIAGEIGSTVPAAEFAIFAAHPQCISAQRLAGTTHFVPLERSDEVRAAIAAVLV